MISSLKQNWQNPQSRVVSIVFATNSLLFGGWLSRIPEIKEILDLTEGELGVALLGLPIGAILAMPVAKRLIQRYGQQSITFWSAILFCVFAIIPLLAWSQITLSIGLFLLGIVGSCLNISMNAIASTVEKVRQVPLMTSFHGIYSLGGMFGALIASGFIALKVGLIPHFILLGILLITVLLFIKKTIFSIPSLPTKQTSGEQSFFPPKQVLGLVLIGFCIMIGEGAVADWSAILIRDYLAGAPTLAGLGFGGFSLAMAMGRLNGGVFINRWGNKRTIILGTTLAVFGLTLTLLIHHPLVAILGFTFVGLGYACTVPILYSAVTTIDALDDDSGIAYIAASGIVGLMIGPPLIGFIAEYSNLFWGFGFILVLAFVGILTTFFNKTVQ